MTGLSSDMCQSDVKKIQMKKRWTKVDASKLARLKKNMGQSKLTRMRLRFSPDSCEWINRSDYGKEYRQIRVLEEQRKKLRKVG